MFDGSKSSRRFQLILIKPSHYDDEGYLIRWWRAMSPSNSLASVYGIAADCAERKVLGSDIAIDIAVMDETNTRIDVSALIERFRRHRNFGCVALVGVQSNQYPRALDIARPFRAAGIPVAIGGKSCAPLPYDKETIVSGLCHHAPYTSPRSPGVLSPLLLH